MLDIAWQSLRNRWSTALLAVLAIAISVALILTVDQVRRDARTAFVQTVSGTDLVIGARSGAVQLLLYSVFRMGNATNNMSWESATEIAERQEVAWTIPLSLGDSYRGYRVLGTNQGYFTHYRFGRDRQLSLNEGVVFDDVFDAVLGSEVARAAHPWTAPFMCRLRGSKPCTSIGETACKCEAKALLRTWFAKWILSPLKSPP